MKAHTETMLLSPIVGNLSIPTWSLSICIQVSATLLLAWRIWTSHAALAGASGRRWSVSILKIIVESGAILSTTTIFLLGFYISKKTVGGVVVAMLGQMDVRDLSSRSIIMASLCFTDIDSDLHSCPGNHD